VACTPRISTWYVRKHFLVLPTAGCGTSGASTCRGRGACSLSMVLAEHGAGTYPVGQYQRVLTSKSISIALPRARALASASEKRRSLDVPAPSPSLLVTAVGSLGSQQRQWTTPQSCYRPRMELPLRRLRQLRGQVDAACSAACVLGLSLCRPSVTAVLWRARACLWLHAKRRPCRRCGTYLLHPCPAPRAKLGVSCLGASGASPRHLELAA